LHSPLLDFFDTLSAWAINVFIFGGVLGLLIRRWRHYCGLALFVASWVIGFDLWLWSFGEVLHLWGAVATAIGVLLAGVGIVPMAIIAAIFHQKWSVAGFLLMQIAIVYVCRLAASALINSAGRDIKRRNTSEAEAVDN
jgi:hypothetical protein